MKQKYILETYDQILKEIKNPKLVFDNDFVAFLENCSDESFLIYKVDFVKQNGEINYTIKKPIHNLHPKVAEMDCIECEPILEFEEFIPEILNELEINQLDVNISWRSKNDNNSLYILEEIENSNLSNCSLP